MPTPLVAGNWKMNGLKSRLSEISALEKRLRERPAGCDVLVCPPFTLLALMEDKGIAFGAQDCHERKEGACTGDVSAAMLRDIGASHVIVGHSERRSGHGETDALVAAKAVAAMAEGLAVIVCVGETEAERDAGKALEIVRAQIAGSLPEGADASKIIIAYEPVWAIGTGRTPTGDDVAGMHAMIRAVLTGRFGSEGENIRILYGGSVKPSNAKSLMAIDNVNGALVGGASLNAAEFDGIIDAYRS